MHKSVTGSWLLLVCLVTGCSGLLPRPVAPPDTYSLGDDPAGVAMPADAAPASAPTLVIGTPVADAGFDSAHMVYVLGDGRPARFAHSVWIDTPARMLLPMIVGAATAGSTFRAVVAAPTSVVTDFRLETELVRLQQEFGSAPSRVRFTLRAYLVRDATREVLASRTFEAVVKADSDSPAGGARAAGLAVRTVLVQLASFCASAAALLPTAP